jgi:hypothetical protein
MKALEKTWIINLDKSISLNKIEDFFKIKDDPTIIFLSSMYKDPPKSNSYKSKVLVVNKQDLCIFSEPTDKCKIYCLESDQDYYI